MTGGLPRLARLAAMADPDTATLDLRFGGIPALYAAIWSEARAAATRGHLAIVAEVVMVVVWFAIRSTSGLDGRAYVLWVIAAGALALVAPLSGLVVFVATSVAFEPVSVARALTPRELMLGPLAVGVLLRIGADRFRWRPAPAIWLILALGVGTALGVANTFARFPEDFAWRAAGTWCNFVATPVIVLIAAAWTARGVSRRIIVVACGVAVVSAVVCLAEYASPGVVSKSRLDWFGSWLDFHGRLAGTIPSPNALSAQLIVPTMVLLAGVALARDVRLTVVALVAAAPLLIAHYLTFSRASLLGLYVFAVVVAWRFRRALGIAVLVVGVVVGVALLPSYLQLRPQHSGGAVIPGTVLVASDENRFRAWGAAAAMWRDEPLTGQGFLAYNQLAKTFGDPILGSPHNEWLRLFAEEGTVVGLIGIAFVIGTAWSLARIPGWLGTGLLAGFLAYVVAASFNNPFIFIRVSAVVFSMIGVGLALAERARAPASADAPTQAEAAPQV